MMARPIKDNYYLHIAQTVSERSTCLKRHYGCVIVKDNEIISTGYNGSPRGEVNCCDFYKECPRVNKPHNSGDYSDCHSVHAEQNAMLSASRKDMLGATMYLAGFEVVSDEGYGREIYPCEPCPICARMIRNAGIKRVVTTSMNLELYKEE
jgi:Deoxycytidylate deaminase